METPDGKVSTKVADDFNYTDSDQPAESESAAKEDTSSEEEDADQSPDENNSVSDDDEQNQMVAHPFANGDGNIVHAPEPLNSHPATSSRKDPNKVLPSVGAYTVQCAKCFQWRLIPTKEKYEEIRENIREEPFYCETASEWKPGVSCVDSGDLQQDNTRLWAIDKPSIARPPPGWQRLLRIRGEGSLRFADVYYEAPSGKRFRSLNEIQKYLTEIPELAAGISLSQFSFLIPKPLQANYVKKRPSGMKSSRPQELDEVCPIEWVGSPGRPDGSRNGQPETSPSPLKNSAHKSADKPAKKKAKKTSSTKDDVPSP